MDLDLATFRLELARAGFTKRRLAAAIGVPVSTMSGWLNGAHRAPADFAARVESALQLRSGSLTFAPRLTRRPTR